MKEDEFIDRCKAIDNFEFWDPKVIGLTRKEFGQQTRVFIDGKEVGTVESIIPGWNS